MNPLPIPFLRMVWLAALIAGAPARAATAEALSTQPGILRSEPIYSQAPYPQCHASTLVETKSGLVAAWFGGTKEGNPDVGIWASRFRDGKWTPVVEVANAARYGVVRVEDAKVIAFEEKQVLAGSGWINAGLYNLSAELFSEFQDGRSFSIERELFPQLVSRHQLKATSLTTDFIDIGIPEDYFRFCRWIEAGKTGTL